MRNPREVYGRTLVELGKEDDRIVVCDADLSKSTMSCYFQDAFADRFFEMGIAEANMASFAAGLSLAGKIHPDKLGNGAANCSIWRKVGKECQRQRR